MAKGIKKEKKSHEKEQFRDMEKKDSMSVKNEISFQDHFFVF